jgi:peptide/nickel transport system substrate-binding protein
MHRFFRSVFLSVVMFAAGLSAYAQQGTLRISVPAMPSGYSIVASAGLADILATNLIGEGLTRWKKDTLQVEPALASSWKANADATVWTFKLRHGVLWHDGKPLTAEDVKFTMDLIIDKKVRSAAASQVAGLKSVEITAPDEIRMVMEHPAADLPVMLAYRMPIVPKHALEGQDPNQPTAFLKKPIGTGPFMFSKAMSGQSWTAVANPKWWGGKVALGGVELRISPDANSAVAQLKAESVDVALVQAHQISALEGGKIAISTVDQPSVYYVSLLNNKPPFDDVRVRRALNYAVDVDSIIKAVVGGYATRATGIIAPSVEGYTADVTRYLFNPDKAKSLLAEAGWTLVNGKMTKGGEPMKVQLTTSTGVIGGPQLAQIIQQQFGQIGIDSTINMVDFRELWTGLFAGHYQASVEYVNLQPSPDITNALACGASYNRFAYCDKHADALLAQAAATVEPATRAAKYAELQKLVAENPPGIFLYYPKEIRAISELVADFPKTPIRMATTHLFDVSVRKSGSR